MSLKTSEFEKISLGGGWGAEPPPPPLAPNPGSTTACAVCRRSISDLNAHMLIESSL
jgi:hypothetical protein